MPHFRICRECGDKKQVKNKVKAGSDICRPCYNEQAIIRRTHVCIDCGREKLYGCSRDVRKVTRCKPCSNKHKIKMNGFKIKKPRPTYTYECDTCHKDITIKSKPKSNTCADCTRKKSKPSIKMFRVCIDCGDKKQVRDHVSTLNKRCRSCSAKARKTEQYFRVCQVCGDKKEARTKEEANAKMCRSCSSKSMTGVKKARPSGLSYKKSGKPRKMNPSENTRAIDRARKINAEHREAVKHRKVKKKARELTPEEERSMIDDFYKNNTVIHVECKQAYGTSDQMRIGD